MPDRPRPLTGKQLRHIRDQWGRDRVVRVLLWEISRLRDVVRILCRRVVSLTRYSRDGPIVPSDPDVDQVFDTEPVIFEDIEANRARHTATPNRHWTHWTDEDQDTATAKKQGEASDREAKRQAREAR